MANVMNKTKIIIRILGICLFVVGVTLGMLLFGSAVWADLESSFYGFEEMGGGRLPGLDCPILMTTSDIQSVGATFKNPNDIPIDFMVRADFSNKGLFRIEREMLSLDANKSKKVEWQVSSEDIDMDYFIFAQVSNYPAQELPFRQSTCGIVVINLPQLSGKLVFSVTLIIILVGIVGGLAIWEASSRPTTGKIQDTTRAMKTLGILVLLGMLVSFMGSWVLGLVMFVGSILAIGVILGFYLAQ